MVLQDTIDTLRERPHHERHVVALGVSVAVVVVLFLGWLFFFFRNLNSVDVPKVQDSFQQTVQNATPQPPESTGWVSEIPVQEQPRGNVEQNGPLQLIEEGSSTNSVQ